jgi:hypothetical protein
MARDFEAYKKSTYDWKPGHEKMLRITKSSLTSDFDFCPQQYYFKRILGRKSPQTDAMTRGINIHNAMEEFYVLVRPVLSKSLSLLKDGQRGEAFKLLWQSLPTPETPYELGEREVLIKRINWELDRLEMTKGEKFLPVINEDEIHVFTTREFEFNGENHTIPIHFAGMIDRGFENEDGSISLMELKTGKWKQRWDKKKEDWVHDPFKVKGMRKEMAYYVDLLNMANHPLKNVTHWGWFYPDGSCGEDMDNIRFVDHWDHEKVKGTYSKMNEKDIQSLLEAYFTGNYPPVPHQKKCAWCDFTEECAAWLPGGEHYWPRW